MEALYLDSFTPTVDERYWFGDQVCRFVEIKEIASVGMTNFIFETLDGRRLMIPKSNVAVFRLEDVTLPREEAESLLNRLFNPTSKTDLPWTRLKKFFEESAKSSDPDTLVTLVEQMANREQINSGRALMTAFTKLVRRLHLSFPDETFEAFCERVQDGIAEAAPHLKKYLLVD